MGSEAINGLINIGINRAANAFEVEMCFHIRSMFEQLEMMEKKQAAIPCRLPHVLMLKPSNLPSRPGCRWNLCGSLGTVRLIPPSCPTKLDPVPIENDHCIAHELRLGPT